MHSAGLLSERHIPARLKRLHGCGGCVPASHGFTSALDGPVLRVDAPLNPVLLPGLQELVLDVEAVRVRGRAEPDSIRLEGPILRAGDGPLGKGGPSSRRWEDQAGVLETPLGSVVVQHPRLVVFTVALVSVLDDLGESGLAGAAIRILGEAKTHQLRRGASLIFFDQGPKAGRRRWVSQAWVTGKDLVQLLVQGAHVDVIVAITSLPAACRARVGA